MDSIFFDNDLKKTSNTSPPDNPKLEMTLYSTKYSFDHRSNHKPLNNGTLHLLLLFLLCTLQFRNIQLSSPLGYFIAFDFNHPSHNFMHSVNYLQPFNGGFDNFFPLAPIQE